MHGAVTEQVEKRTLKTDNVTRGDNFKGKACVCGHGLPLSFTTLQLVSCW